MINQRSKLHKGAREYRLGRSEKPEVYTTVHADSEHRPIRAIRVRNNLLKVPAKSAVILIR